MAGDVVDACKTPAPAALAAVERVLQQDGLDAAIAWCRARLRAQPMEADTARHLSQLLCETGEHLAAQRAAMRACELQPDDARCWCDLGRVHARKGEFEDAARCFAEALQIDRRHVDSWHNLGLAYRRLNRPDEAFKALKQALQLDDKRAATWIALGELLIERGQDEDGLICFDRAAAAEPAQALARCKLAEQLLARGRVRRAESLFRQALTLDAQHTDAWVGLGRTLEDLGQADEARAAYLAALQRRPAPGLALGNYLALLRGDARADGDESARLLGLARTALHAESTPDEARAFVGQGLAKFHLACDDPAAAIQATRTGQAARRRAHGPLDRPALAARVDALIDCFNADFYASRRRHGLGCDQPVFIVGLPRSGTTLTEQILAGHPQVHGAGELPSMARLALDCGGGDVADIAAAIAQLDAGASRAVAARYLHALREGAPRGRLRIVDKAPLNFFHLGFAALLFPNARVIHCRRDLRDTALSIWFENFNAEQRYATDFDDLAFFAGQYRRLMAHWHQHLPLQMLELDYEDTVADVPLQARRMTAFLGLPWDAACVDFHRNSRAVQTPSRWQVREPAHRRSVGRWKAYAPLLPELVRAFAGLEADPTAVVQRRARASGHEPEKQEGDHADASS